MYKHLERQKWLDALQIEPLVAHCEGKTLTLVLHSFSSQSFGKIQFIDFNGDQIKQSNGNKWKK
jgi:hypothetical protein